MLSHYRTSYLYLNISTINKTETNLYPKRENFKYSFGIFR